MFSDFFHQTFVIQNGKIILPNSVVIGKSLIVKNGKIGAILSTDAVPDDLPIFDAKSSWVAPGFIDIHVHGAVGFTFNTTNLESYTKITEAHLKHGVTSLLATIATAPLDDMLKALAFVDEWSCSQTAGSVILGAHLEGPFFCPKQAGAQDIRNLLTPDNNSISKILHYHSILKIVSLAPELTNALTLIKQLAQLGVIPAAGHSSAKDVDLLKAVDCGLRHIIHIWNAQSMTIREGVWRKPGLVEATLLSDDLSVEMIADNKHLPPTLVKLAIKCVPADKLCLISDATAGAGLTDEEHFYMGAVEYKVKDGVGMTLDETSFAGSTTFLNQIVKLITETANIPLTQAINMCSLNPAKVLGIENQKGSIFPGKDADLVVLNDKFEVLTTFVKGRVAFKKEI